MLMTAVVLPDAFAASHFADPAYHLNTEMFLRGIDSNGLILVDAEERLYHELCDTVNLLAQIGKGKNTHALFEELLKKRRQKVQKFVTTRCSVSSSRSTGDVAAQVTRQCCVDALLVDPVSHPAFSTSGSSTTVIPVPDYASSPVEAERRRQCERLPPADQMAAGEFDSLIVQATRYSRWLRFYDKQIGKGTNLSHFRRGMERILGLWLGAAHFPRSELHAELFTCVDDSQHASFRPDVAYRRVRDDLVGQLAAALSLRITLTFKRDDNSICHPRHLQTQSLALLFERGFDFINDDQSLRRCIVRIDGGCAEHLQEYRQLPGYTPPT